MGVKHEQNAYATREEAEADQSKRGQPGYSERYPRGITEAVNALGKTVYISHAVEYYG